MKLDYQKKKERERERKKERKVNIKDGETKDCIDSNTAL